MLLRLRAVTAQRLLISYMWRLPRGVMWSQCGVLWRRSVLQYGFPQLKNPNGGCSGNVSCDGSVVMLGLESTYRFQPEATFAPWLGVGFGYEWASADFSAPNAGGGATDKGFQALVQAGGDVRVTPKLVLGPFLEASFGRFDSADTRVRFLNTTTQTSADITNTAWHTWVTLGVRGAFDI